VRAAASPAANTPNSTSELLPSGAPRTPQARTGTPQGSARGRPGTGTAAPLTPSGLGVTVAGGAGSPVAGAGSGSDRGSPDPTGRPYVVAPKNAVFRGPGAKPFVPPPLVESGMPDFTYASAAVVVLALDHGAVLQQ
jgi:hypothetical protein